MIDIVDDFSRYSWVYFLETKDEVFGLVRDLILRLKKERQYDPIRAIRSDNGTEFKNARFEAFCREHGLEHKFSSPHVCPIIMELLGARTGPSLRWLG